MDRPERYPVSEGRQNGFALVIAMVLMGFLLLLSLSLAVLTLIETSVSGNMANVTKARENARLGLFVALGRLRITQLTQHR